MVNNQGKVKRLFVDIETSPNVVLSWRVGYDIKLSHENIIKERKIIMIGYKWEGEAETHVLIWDRNQDDKKMLVEFLELAIQADEVIGHYLDRFDMPWIKARCLILGLDPMPLLKTIDTKAWASKYYYFNSCKLDYLGEILGFGKKIDTNFDLWKDIVLNKDEKALAEMARYCAQDIQLLEDVYHKLAGCVKPKTHAGVFAGHDKWSCAFCASLEVKGNKRCVSSEGTVKHQMQCKSCGKYYYISATPYTNYLETKKKPVPQVRRLAA